MYFVDVLKVLARQWVVLAVGALVLAAGAVGVLRAVPTAHQATGQLLLLLPAEASGLATPTNPYLNLPDEMTTTASILAGSMMTKDTERDLASQGFTSEYDVTVVPGAGPIILITAKDTDPSAGLETRDELISRLEAELAKIQEAVDVPERQLIRATPSSVGQVAEALPGNKIRALAVLVGVVGTLTCLVAFLRDRRRERVPRVGRSDATAA